MSQEPEEQLPSKQVRQSPAPPPPPGELIVETPQAVATVPASTQTTVVVSNGHEQSALGYWGLLLSLCGVVTCGITSLPGFFVSLAGMFCRGPKACAIWGTVLGLAGSVPFAMFVLPFLLIFVGLAGGAAVTAGAVAAAGPDVEVSQPKDSPAAEDSLASELPDPARDALPLSTDPQAEAEEELPSDVTRLEQEFAAEELSRKIADLEGQLQSLRNSEPKLPALGLRKWEASTGQTVVAKLIRINESHVKLEKEDGSQVNVARSQLSISEQERLDDKYSSHVAEWKSWQEMITNVEADLKELQSEQP